LLWKDSLNTPAPKHWLSSRHVMVATDTYSTIQEKMEAVFSLRSGRCGKDKNLLPMPGFELQASCRTCYTDWANTSERTQYSLILYTIPHMKYNRINQLHGAEPFLRISHFMEPEASLLCSLFLILSQINEVYTTPTSLRPTLVGIAIGYGLDDQGVRVRITVGSRIFSTSSRPVLGSIQPPIQWVTGLKRPGREVGHSPPASAEVNRMWIYTSTPPYACMA
jgi:hypothetical protein